MKKISRVLIVAMLAFTLMAGAAFAGSIAITGPLAYPGEAAKFATITLDLSTGLLAGQPDAVISNCGADGTEEIDYTTTSDLPSSARVVFHIANGKWQTGVKYFLLDINNGFVTLAGSDVVTASDITFIIGNQVIPANTVMALSTTEVAVTSPVINIGGNIAGTALTIGVPQCFDAVGPIVGGTAPPVTLITFFQQFSWQLEARTKTIDVNSPSLRTEFLPWNGPGSGGGNFHARAPLGLINSAYGNCNDTWRISLNSGEGIATLRYTLDDAGGQLNKLEDLFILTEVNNITEYDFTVNSAGTQATLAIAADENYALHDTNIDTLVQSLTGEVKLNPDTFKITATLDFTNDNLYADVSLAQTTIIIWDINGWVGTVPYMFASGTQAEDTFIKIFNNSTVDGEVTVDVTPDAGGTVLNVSLGTVPAGTIGIFWAGSGAGNIAELAGLPLGSAFGAVFIVNAPQNNVTAIADQKRPGAVDRVVPVYTGSEGYKNW